MFRSSQQALRNPEQEHQQLINAIKMYGNISYHSWLPGDVYPTLWASSAIFCCVHKGSKDVARSESCFGTKQNFNCNLQQFLCQICGRMWNNNFVDALGRVRRFSSNFYGFVFIRTSWPSILVHFFMLFTLFKPLLFGTTAKENEIGEMTSPTLFHRQQIFSNNIRSRFNLRWERRW